MLYQVAHILSLNWVLIQSFWNKLLCLYWKLFWQFKVTLHNFLHCLFPWNVVKWCFSHNHFESKYADCPNINALIISFTFKNFWTYIIKCTTVCFSSCVCINSPSEITQFTDILELNKKLRKSWQYFRVLCLCGWFHFHANTQQLSILV